MKAGELGAMARRIVRAGDRASLGTTERGSGGQAYVSLVALATAADGAPLLLLSALSEHTRNLAEDDRVSLLVAARTEQEDPLAGPRVTLMGRLRRSNSPDERARYLRRHPAASLYAGFADFAIHRLEIARAHLVAGFGTARWLEPARLAASPLLAQDADELAVLEGLHGEQRALLDRLAAVWLDAAPGEGVATGIDREGLDLRAGPRTTRIPFEPPLGGAAEVPAALASSVPA